MSVVKVIEIMAESNQSWEDAVKAAVREAAKSVSDIQSVYVKDMQATVEGNQITAYRVNTKISFKVKEHE